MNAGSANPAALPGFGNLPPSLGGGATPDQIIQLVNEINQGAQQTANAGRIPGGADLENLSSANISSALEGQLDPSVLQQLGQRSAERGIITGSPGGPSTNAEYLRSLGLTTMDLMNTGQNWLTQATARNPAAPIYDAGNLVITPQQQAQIDAENRSLQEQIRSNQAQEAIARMRGGGGGGGGVGGGMPRISGGGGGYNGPSLFLPQQTGNTLTGTGSFSSSFPVSQPGQADSLWNMGGDYFQDSIVSPGGTSYTAPTSLIDTGWDDYFDNTFYGGTPEPVNFFDTGSSLMDSSWDSWF